MAVEAVRRLAGHARRADVTQAALDQPGPHAAVDLRRLGVLGHERPEWAGRRRDDGGVAADLLQRGLEPERADCGEAAGTR